MSLSADLDLPAVLQRIISAATDLVDARHGALGVLDETRTSLAQFLTVGIDPDIHEAIGDLPRGHGILGLLIVDPKPLRLPDLNEHPDSYGFPPRHPPMRSFLGVPIRVRDEVFGNLYLTDKRSAEVFTDVDEELVVALAAAAGVAIENARLHARLQDLAVLHDRERIARDLHDTVIQRLFATGLSLQGAVRFAQRSEAADRIQTAIEDLDDTVRHIRTVIFGLESSQAKGVGGVRQQIMALTKDAAGSLGFDPRVVFDGPVDAAVDEATAPELLATLREALSNVARHADASRVGVEVTAGEDIVLLVADNGRGCGGEAGGGPGHGLRNMRARAEALGGHCEVAAGDDGGTKLQWKVPIKRPEGQT